MSLRFIWLCFGTFSIISTQEPVANLPMGRVVGIKVFTENSLIPIEVFFGIPYALPPVGRLRFSPPEKHPGWKRTLFAHRIPPRCPHPSNDTNNFNEDCLYLNIWTPRRGEGKLLPVIIILYSESWNKGGINLPCQELAGEGLVIVTVAFRLSIFSFFTLKSILARGNLALLDQYLAMVWVRENIAAFGGDPNSITLLGHSAGADSVLLHIASPRSVGLFQRAIIMSPKNIWKTIEKDRNSITQKTVKLSESIIESLGCFRETIQNNLQCLRTRSVSDFMGQYTNNWTDLLGPVPDDFLPGSEQYLPNSLALAYSSTSSKSIHLEVLMGTTNLEAIDLENYRFILREGGVVMLQNNISTIIPETLQLLSLDRTEKESILSQAILWEFLGSKTRKESEQDTIGMLEDVARMETSAKWGAGAALLAAKLARKVSRLYVYRYLQPNYVDLRGLRLNFTGATNGAELLALLGDSLMLQAARRPSSEIEKRISLKFRSFISNFVKFGSPDNEREWPRYMVGDSYIHEICDAGVICNEFKTSKEIAFWLQYLPRLSNSISLQEQAEKITSSNDGSQLRGGVFAMCGFSTILLLLLVASVILLYRKRTIRTLDFDSEIVHKNSKNIC